LNSVVEAKNNEIGSLKSQIQELNMMGITINSLQERIQRLVSENKGLGDEVRDAQENLRLSAQQNQKIVK
jgi:sensor histidine kinase YesM